MKVVQGYAVDPESLPFVQNPAYLPFRGQGKWKHEIMERACDFGGDCGMAYFCPLFPLAQMSERIRLVLGNIFGIKSEGDGYRRILITGVVWVLIDILITVLTGSSGLVPMLTIFCAMISCQLRGIIRQLHGIPGSKTDDCCLSFFCQPCTIMQMVGTLWANPKQVPGCSFDKSPAFEP